MEFENYLLFAGATNLGLTVFTKIKREIRKRVKEKAANEAGRYASIISTCLKCCQTCTECPKKANADTRNNYAEAQKAMKAVRETTENFQKETKATAKLITTIASVLAILCVIAISCILCAGWAADIYKWCLVPKLLIGLIFLSPILLMTGCLGISILISVCGFTMRMDTEIKKFFCSKALEQAKEKMEEISQGSTDVRN